MRWFYAMGEARSDTYLALKVDVFDVFPQPLRILDTLKRRQFL